MSRKTVLLRKKLAQRGAQDITVLLPRDTASTGRTQITEHKYGKKPVRSFAYWDRRGLQVIHVYEVEEIKKVKGKKGSSCTKRIKPDKMQVWQRNMQRPAKRK